ncbi:MAG: 4Fe-4S dicluster domain-containing protein, partial [Fusobacterium sp.]
MFKVNKIHTCCTCYTIKRNEKCVACGECVFACPCDVLRVDENLGYSVVKYPYDCQLCNLCVYYCPYDALELTGEKNGASVVL